ncbi:S9 family peptidase [Chitinolyticbacter meiyuanensis]|uniref:S9 family peptidase n=1 Tax=Chitinolyticbacter meiyuanensis TaxID=682798 RepID=UPI0011E5D9FD|nr:S9 family peptidase [Chitinolyticbacter meiyuanensis]
MPLPPIAPRRPRRLKKHGETRIDDYYWLRDKDDPAVLDYLQAENAYAEVVMADSKPLQDTLFAEMKARIREDDSSVPYRLGDWMYYYRYEVGGQYPLLCRKRWHATDDWQSEPEQLLLDVNALAAGQPYMEVGEFEISPDGQWLAYSTDATGYRQYTLRIKDLASDALLDFSAERVTSAAWALDNRTLFFTTEDAETKRSNQLWRWQRGSAVPVLVREERDARFGVDVYLSRSQRFLICQSGSHTTSEIRVLPATRPLGRWRVLLRRRAGIEYSVEHGHDRFWLRINDQGRHFRLVTVPDHGAIGAAPSWTEILPERNGVMLEGVDLFRDFLVCHERVNGLGQLVVTELASGEHHTVAFDEAVYSLAGGANAEWDSRTYRFGYESLTTPDTVYDYDLASRERTLRKRRPVLGDFDPAHYASERLWATAPDGTQVPISLVRRRDATLPAPLWLEGYGAYGAPNDVYFSSSRLSLLDRGFSYAVAHIRGGGDLGKTWHDAGRLANKHHTFSDFIACAEHLFATGHTTPQQLVIEGGSAGGLLIGAVLNQRPDLCRLAILEVPFVDVLTTMLDPDLPLTVGEYEEWGNPNRREQYGWLRAYSPYDNLATTAYPAMLVRTSLNDSQVMYWEPAKYVARLRTLKTDANPLLFITNLDAGHGGASGRFDHLREVALAYGVALGL